MPRCLPSSAAYGWPYTAFMNASSTSSAEPRFEFRVWGDDLEEIAGSIRTAGEPVDTHSRQETYLVTPWSAAVNIKIRDDELDVKTCGTVSHGFQRWQVRHKSPFPVEAGTLRREIFMRLGLPARHCDRPVYTVAQLVDELVAAEPALYAVDVAKDRSQFAIGDVTAEVTAVTIDDAAISTVAIESTNLAALRSLRRHLDLEGEDNVAYPLAIRRILRNSLAGD